MHEQNCCADGAVGARRAAPPSVPLVPGRRRRRTETGRTRAGSKKRRHTERRRPSKAILSNANVSSPATICHLSSALCGASARVGPVCGVLSWSPAPTGAREMEVGHYPRPSPSFRSRKSFLSKGGTLPPPGRPKSIGRRPSSAVRNLGGPSERGGGDEAPARHPLPGRPRTPLR